MKQIFGIKEHDFTEFVKKLNECYASHKAFATQTFNDNKNFYALVYFDDLELAKETVQDNDKPTPKQIAYLENMNVEIPKTKKEATETIKQIIEQKKKSNY